MYEGGGNNDARAKVLGNEKGPVRYSEALVSMSKYGKNSTWGGSVTGMRDGAGHD
jgi:hypothetical protein